VNPPNVKPTLAYLLENQGRLLDAYLQQNLGKRFAYAIYVVPVDLSETVEGVSNCHAPVIVQGADFAARQFSMITPGGFLDVENLPHPVKAIPPYGARHG
jgi:hypothetical protein